MAQEVEQKHLQDENMLLQSQATVKSEQPASLEEESRSVDRQEEPSSEQAYPEETVKPETDKTE